MKNNPDQAWPADVYLEGADQYRGWFQSSLLTAVGALGEGAPYKAVLTHGWVVDGEGKAMHKSLGNTIAPEEIIKKYGADMLRLWVASSDYHVDVRASESLSALTELGIIPRENGNVNPNSPLTRAQTAKILMSLLEYRGKLKD